MSDKLIKILVVDDSPLIRSILTNLFSEVDDMKVIDTASDGEEAVQKVKELKPDIVTMDVEMPKLNGFEATKIIMSECPTPVVVITSHKNNADMDTMFNALDAGALTVLDKPKNIFDDEFDDEKAKLIETIRILSEIHVIPRRLKQKVLDNDIMKQQRLDNRRYKLLAIGASTGGPMALHFLLTRLPEDFPVPIVIVQHITPGFIYGLVQWLQKDCKLTIHKISDEYTKLKPGNVYFADDSKHLLIKSGDYPTAVLDDSDPVNHFKPSVSKLFSSVAEAYPGKAMAGLLTGMGRDGADGLLMMKNKDCITFIQDKESCIVNGMPEAARKLGAEVYDLTLEKMPRFLEESFRRGDTNE